MTGKELIIYILQNDLENEIVVKDGVLVRQMFMDEKEAAAKFGVGISTIKAWHACGMLSGTKINDHLYFLRNASEPRKTDDKKIIK